MRYLQKNQIVPSEMYLENDNLEMFFVFQKVYLPQIITI